MTLGTVVSSGQVVESFQRVLGSEVKLSPACCCLSDTALQSDTPPPFFAFSLIVCYRFGACRRK